MRLIFAMILALALAVPALAKKPDNTGTTKKYQAVDILVDTPMQIVYLEAVTPYAIRIVCDHGYDASGYVLPQYYTFTDAVGNVRHYSLFTDRVQPTFYTDGAMIQNFIPGETYSVTLLSTDRDGNYGYAAPYVFTMPDVWGDMTPPEITDVRVTYSYFTNYHAVLVRATDASGIRAIAFYCNDVLLYEQVVAGDLDPYVPGKITMYAHPYSQAMYGYEGTLTVRVTDNAGNVSERHLAVTL